MDMDWKQLLMSKDELLAMMEEFDARTPESFDGMLSGGHTAKAVVIALLRLAVRVSDLEEQVAEIK